MTEQPITPLRDRIGRVLASAKALTSHMDAKNQQAAQTELRRLMLLSKELDRAIERGDK